MCEKKTHKPKNTEKQKQKLNILSVLKIAIMQSFKTKVGYTMRDIRYFWRDGLSSVGMSSEVELPQFRVLGHRQRATEINLTTGTQIKTYKKQKQQNQLFLIFTKSPY